MLLKLEYLIFMLIKRIQRARNMTINVGCKIQQNGLGDDREQRERAGSYTRFMNNKFKMDTLIRISFGRRV